MMSMKKIYKHIYFNMLDILKIDKKYLKSIIQNKNLVILNLHRVSNDKNPFYPSLTPELFEELLKYITKEFNVITFREIKKYKNSKKPNIILSFDDGFYDFLEYSMPILEKYDVQANLNVIPYCIESTKPVWDVMLGDLLNQVSIDIINKIEFPNFEMKLNQSNKGKYALSLTDYLKQRPKVDREKLWLYIEEIIKKENIQLTKMLNRDEVIEISKTHEIGCHSYSHESMGIESKDFFEEDFFRCKEYFKKELCLPLNIYAFPSGSYKEYQLDFLINNSIEHILLVNEKYSKYNTCVYNRFTFYGDSISEIKMRSLGWNNI